MLRGDGLRSCAGNRPRAGTFSECGEGLSLDYACD